VLGKSVQPGYVPLVTGGQITGNLSLDSQQVHDYSSGSLVTRAADAAELGIIEQYRSELIEGIIEESEDADLMDRYLEGDELKEDELLTDLLTAILHGRFYPVIGVNSLNGIGTEQLLTVIENSFPQPGTHRLRVTTPGGQDIESLSGDPAGPLVAEVIRTTSDQFAGRLSLVRIYNGTLKIDDVVHVSGHRSLFTGAADPAHPDHDDDERVGPLSVPSGIETTSVDTAIAGQLVYVSKLSKAETADTLSPKERPALVEPWNLPEPLLPVAIRAASRNDEDKLPGALARLVGRGHDRQAGTYGGDRPDRALDDGPGPRGPASEQARPAVRREGHPRGPQGAAARNLHLQGLGARTPRQDSRAATGSTRCASSRSSRSSAVPASSSSTRSWAAPYRASSSPPSRRAYAASSRRAYWRATRSSTSG